MSRQTYQDAVYERLTAECVISITRTNKSIKYYCREVNELFNKNVPVSQAAKSLSKRWTKKPWDVKKRKKNKRNRK